MFSRKNLCLDYTMAKEKATSVYEPEGSNLITLHYAYQIKGDTGKYFNIQAIVKALKPHPDYPDHLLVISTKSDGKGVSKYYRECARREESLFDNLARSLPNVTLEGRFLVGVKEYEVKDEKGNRKSAYEHFFYEPKHVSEKPVASEWYRGSNITGRRSYLSKAKSYPSELIKYNYFEIENAYYEGAGDPLQDAMNGKTEVVKEEMLQKINAVIPYIGREADFNKIFPTYIYKGYIGLTYFDQKVGFNKQMNMILDEYEGKAILPKSVVKNGCYETFHQFMFAYKDQAQKFKDRIAQVKVYDDYLLGEPLKDYENGQMVVIYNPTKGHSVLKGLEGKVVGKKEDKILIEFLNYVEFRAAFSGKEIVLKEELAYMQEEERIV